jgi:hypothetical protein
MVHVHGGRVQQLSARTAGASLQALVAVPVDVGKASSVAMVCDFTGQVLVASDLRERGWTLPESNR